MPDSPSSPPGTSHASQDRGRSLHPPTDGEQEAPQPPARDGVSTGMGTMAIHPTTQPSRPLNGLSAARQSPASSHGDATGDFSGMEDSAIMLELRAGNMDAFDVLLTKYRRPIISFMFRMVHNQAVAEELAQEVFLRIFRSRETYRAEARFSTWLYRIATNLSVNHARDTRHERSAAKVYLDEADEETGSTPDVPDSTPGVETRMVRDERMQAIRDRVMALPERQRNAVLMHKYQGMDYRQIGEVLKLSESATKSLLFRAYQTLRDTLKDFV